MEKQTNIADDYCDLISEEGKKQRDDARDYMLEKANKEILDEMTKIVNKVGDIEITGGLITEYDKIKEVSEELKNYKYKIGKNIFNEVFITIKCNKNTERLADVLIREPLKWIEKEQEKTKNHTLIIERRLK